MHDLGELTSTLKKAGFSIHIETSGVYPLTGEFDWICFSPKKFKKPHPVIFDRAHELKVIVYNQSDLDWAGQFEAKVNPECRLYLQPEWSRSERMIQIITGFILENPQWEISLQIHKYMNIP
jgi:organic radical activating enzyme